MKTLLGKVDVDYWFNVAVAVFFAWKASASDDRAAMFLLFAASFFLIHAHGHRILEAIKEQEND
jgi:hypothetical protein